MATVRVIYDLIARDNASSSFGRAGGAADRLHGSLTRVIRTAALAGTAVGATATAVAAMSVKMATDFQASMTKIQTQTGGTARDVKALSADVLKLATYAQQGPQALADSMYHLKSVGLDNVKAMRALKVASDLAAVGGANLEDTTNAIAGAWRSGIKGAHDFGLAAATVNAIIGAGNMRMDAFVNALGSGILASARSFGVSLRSVGAALALMTDEGIPATDASTRLRMSLSLLGAPSQAAEKQLKSIGLTGLDLANAMRSPGGLIAAIGLLRQKLDQSGLSASAQAQVLSRAFGGGRTSSAILTLLNNYDVLIRKQKQINDSISRFGPAVVAQRKTAQAQFDLLKSNLDVLAIKIGTKLLPPVTGFVHFLSTKALPGAETFAHTLGHLIPFHTIKTDVSKAVSAIDGFFHWLTGKTSGGRKPLRLGRVVTGPDLASLLSPTAGSSGFNWGSLFGRIFKEGAGWLTSHIADIGRAFANIDWVGIGKQVGGQALPFAIGFMDEVLSPLFTLKFWEKHWTDALFAAASLWGGGKLAKPLGTLAEKMGLKLLGSMLKGWGNAVDKITNPIIKGAGKVIGAIGRGLIDGIKHVFPEVGGALEEHLILLPTRIGDAARSVRSSAIKLAKGIGSGILTGTEKLASIIGKVIGHIVKPFAKAGSWLIGKGADVIRGLWDGIFGRETWLGKNIRTTIDNMLAFFKDAPHWLVTSGKDLISGLFSGIRSMMDGIGKWIKTNVVDPLIEAVKHWFGIHSPSTVMMPIGGHLMAGLFHGMMRFNSSAMISRIFGGMPQALGALAEKGLLSLSSLPGRAMHALGSLGHSIWDKIAGLFGGGGSGVQQWAGLAAKVLAMLHQPGGYLGIVLRQMMTESGGNPRAVNLWDINAKMGHPSKGLMQVIDPTFAAYAGPFRGLGIWNPLANIYAGLNYAIHRYGPSWASVLGQGHGYATGSWSVPETGPALVHKGEMILPAQLAAAIRGAMRGGGNAPLIGTLNINHVPGISTQRDVENAVKAAWRQVRLARA